MKGRTNKITIIKWTSILAILFFIVTTFLTSKEEAIVDGFNEYGFPFRFYTFSDGKKIENIVQPGFNLIDFTWDIVIATALAFIAANAINKFHKPKNQN